MAHLQLNHISKYFPGVKALDDVSMSVEAGEILALCGENGAGKSTLMNILTGNIQPDSGNILINKQTASIANPRDAFSQGIAIVYQQLSLVDSLSIAENIFANQQPVNSLGLIQFEELYYQTELLLHQLQLDGLNARTIVSKLSPAEKQLVEIAKALSKNPSIFILDEPTASLTDKETKTLFSILQKLKQEGVAIIYISHRLDEIFILADRISILKDGTFQGTFLKQELTKKELIKRMVGREVIMLTSQSHKQHAVILDVQNLSGNRFKNISFQLHQGEILGIAGLIGAGRTELARALFGADQPTSGMVTMHNKVVKFTHPADAIAHGIAYVPEERKSLGLFMEMTIANNIISGQLNNATDKGLYAAAKANELAIESTYTLRIATAHVQQKVNTLSGGNQQKIVIAKWLHTNPEVLIVDEPTHGIDVGARFEIYEILKSLAEQGKGIIMISSDLPELLAVCDRILVLKKGELAGEISASKATEETILTLAAN